MIIQCRKHDNKHSTAFGVHVPDDWATDFNTLQMAKFNDFDCVKFQLQDIAIGVQLIEKCSLIGYIHLTETLAWEPIGAPWFMSNVLPPFMLSFFDGSTLLLKQVASTTEERPQADIDRSIKHYNEGAEKLLTDVSTDKDLLMRYYAETPKFYWL